MRCISAIDAILTDLGIENPDLLNPAKQRSREDWLRLKGYRERLAASGYVGNGDPLEVWAQNC